MFQTAKIHAASWPHFKGVTMAISGSAHFLPDRLPTSFLPGSPGRKWPQWNPISICLPQTPVLMDYYMIFSIYIYIMYIIEHYRSTIVVYLSRVQN